jgi:hypothetical protein
MHGRKADEMSNLAGELGEPLRTHVCQTLAEAMKLLPEHHVPSRAASADAAFLRFGLTDALIASLGTGDMWY